MIPATPASRRRPFFFVSLSRTVSIGSAILVLLNERFDNEINAFSWQCVLCADSGQKAFHNDGEPFGKSGSL
jgi:hypothetical protein